LLVSILIDFCVSALKRYSAVYLEQEC
jgi:hypothetical protein